VVAVVARRFVVAAVVVAVAGVASDEEAYRHPENWRDWGRYPCSRRRRLADVADVAVVVVGRVVGQRQPFAFVVVVVPAFVSPRLGEDRTSWFRVRVRYNK